MDCWYSVNGFSGRQTILVDLSQYGSVECIASFIGAGLMLLVMGYFAPLPPARKEISSKEVASADSTANLKTESIKESS
jgi:hypothetical protein